MEKHAEDDTARRDEESGEYTLQCQDLYQDFTRLIESNIKGFLEQENMSEQELKALCEQAMKDDRGTATSKFLEAWIASWEFESFMELLEGFRLELLQDWGDEAGEAKGGEEKAEEGGEAKGESSSRVGRHK